MCSVLQNMTPAGRSHPGRINEEQCSLNIGKGVPGLKLTTCQL